jgi:hypothetical protein
VGFWVDFFFISGKKAWVAASCLQMKGKKRWKAKQLFHDLPVKTSQPFGMTVWVFGQKVFLTGARSECGELMIVAKY